MLDNLDAGCLDSFFGPYKVFGTIEFLDLQPISETFRRSVSPILGALPSW